MKHLLILSILITTLFLFPQAAFATAPTFVSAGVVATDIGGPCAITPGPPTHQANDIIIVAAYNAAGAAMSTATAGWTSFNNIAGTHDIAFFWKRAAGAGTAGPDITAGGTDCFGVAYIIRGAVTTGTPYEDPTNFSDGTTEDNTPDTAAITTTNVDRFAVSFMAHDGESAGVTWSSGNPPATWTASSNIDDTAGTDVGFYVISKTIAAAGEVGTVVMGTMSAPTLLGGVTLAFIPPATAALSGTVTASILEGAIVDGLKTIILTLDGDSWVAVASFDAQRQNIINGLTSAQSETTGWNNEVKAKIPVTDVVRTSNTVVTITLSAEAAYNITAQETITATIPATALVGAAALVATPTFTVDPALAISGSSTGNDGASVKVAVNTSPQTQTATIAVGGAWTIYIPIPAADAILTVWVDSVLDTNESTAVTKWSSGDVTSMVLNTNVLTVGSNQNTSLTVTNMNQYDCTEDEDIMYEASGSNLKVEGTSCIGAVNNSYSDETITISVSDTLTISGTETLTTDNVTITGTLTSGGASAYSVAGDFSNSGVFTQSTSTVTLGGTTTQAIAGSSTTTFNNLTITNSSAEITASIDFNVSGTLNINNASAVVNIGALRTLNSAAAAGIITGTGTVKVSLAGGINDFGTQYKFTTYTLTNLTTDFTGTGADIDDKTYGGLKVSGSVTAATSPTVGGILNVTNSLTPSAGTITMNTGSSISNSGTLTFNNLTIATGATVTTSASFTINGTLTNSGTATFNPSGGTITMATIGWSIVNSGTSLTFSGLTISETPSTQPTSSFSISATLTVNSTKTLAPTAGTITMTGGTITNSGGASSNLVFNNLTVSGTTASSSSFEINSVLNVSGGNLSPSAGTITMNTGSSISNSGTLVFNNLTIASGATVTTSASFTINGTITNSATATFNPSAGTITMATTGWSIVNSGTSLIFSGLTISETPLTQPTSSFSASGALTVNSTKTLAPTAGTITMTGGSITNNGGATTNLVFNNITIASGATVTTSSSFTINGTLTNSSTATFNPSAGTITMATTGWSIVNSGTSLIFSGLTISETPLTQPTSSFSASGALTVNSTKTLAPTAGTITMTGGSITNNGGATTNLVFNNITIASGATVTTSSSFTINGTLTNSSTATFNPSGGTITLATTGWSIVNSGTSLTFSGLTISETPLTQPTSSFSVSGALTVNSTKTLAPTAGTITMTGGSIANSGGAATNLVFNNLTISGSVTANSQSFQIAAATSITGTLTVSSGTGIITAKGNITGTGTMTLTAGTLTQSVAGAADFGPTSTNDWTFNNLTFESSFGSQTITTSSTSTGKVVVGATLTISANTILDAANRTWNLTATGTPFTITGTFTANTSTFSYQGSASGVTVTGATYSNLEVGINANATATIFTLGGNTTVGGVLTVGNAGSSANDTLDASTTTLTLSGTSGDPFILTGFGLFEKSTSTVDYTGNAGGNTTIQTATYNNLRLGGGVAENYSPEGAITVSSTLTMNANGTLIGTQNVTVNGDVTGPGTITITGGTFEQSVAANQNFGPSSGTNSWTFATLIFSNSSGVNRTVTTTSGSGGITASTLLQIGKAGNTNATILDAANRTWTLSGTSGTPFNIVSPSDNTSLTASTSTFSYTGANGGGDTTIQDATYYNLIINASDSFVLEATPLTVNSDLTVTLGTLSLAGNSLNVGSTSVTNSGNIAVAGTITQTASGTTTVKTSASGAATIGGAGTLTFYNLTIAPTAASGTITLGSGASQTITVSNNLVLGDGTAVTVTASTNNPTLTVTGNFTNSSNSNFTSTSGNFSVGGNWSNSGSFTNNSGTVTMTAIAIGKTLSGTLTGSTGKFNHLVFNGSGGGWTFNAAAEVGGNLTITLGTVIAPSTTLTIIGNFAHNGGIFTHNSGTVVFTPNTTSQITGATTFNSVTDTTAGSTLEFEAGTIFTFAGTLTVTGASGNRIHIHSTTGSSQWLAQFNNAQSSVTYAHISYAGCNGGTQDITLKSSNVNDGNNDSCWIFLVPPPQVELRGGINLRGGTKLGQ